MFRHLHKIGGSIIGKKQLLQNIIKDVGEKSKPLFWSEVHLDYRKGIAWIIIAIVYLPIIVNMLDSKY